MSKYYKVDKFKYPSVTTIISDCTDKSGPLTQWAANETCEWIRQNCDIESYLYPNGDDEPTEYSYYEVDEKHLNDARFNFRNVSKEALDVGSEVHNAIELDLKDTPAIGELTTPQALNAFNAYLEWKIENKIEPISIEKTVYGNGWGGTLDFLGYMNGKLYVIDFKTNKNKVYKEAHYQVAAYRIAIEDETDDEDDYPVGCGILRLDKETGMPEWKDTSKTFQDDYQVFKHMVELYFARHPRIRAKAGR